MMHNISSLNDRKSYFKGHSHTYFLQDRIKVNLFIYIYIGLCVLCVVYTVGHFFDPLLIISLILNYTSIILMVGYLTVRDNNDKIIQKKMHFERVIHDLHIKMSEISI